MQLVPESLLLCLITDNPGRCDWRQTDSPTRSLEKRPKPETFIVDN